MPRIGNDRADFPVFLCAGRTPSLTSILRSLSARWKLVTPVLPDHVQWQDLHSPQSAVLAAPSGHLPLIGQRDKRGQRNLQFGEENILFTATRSPTIQSLQESMVEQLNNEREVVVQIVLLFRPDLRPSIECIGLAGILLNQKHA